VRRGRVRCDVRITEKAGARFSCHVDYVLPPGVPMIVGPGPVATPTPVSLDFDLPQNFAEGPVVAIQTPFGALNAKFTKLRDFDL
jgi:hypothetical protein